MKVKEIFLETVSFHQADKKSFFIWYLAKLGMISANGGCLVCVYDLKCIVILVRLLSFFYSLIKSSPAVNKMDGSTLLSIVKTKLDMRES